MSDSSCLQDCQQWAVHLCIICKYALVVSPTKKSYAPPTNFLFFWGGAKFTIVPIVEESWCCCNYQLLLLILHSSWQLNSGHQLSSIWLSKDNKTNRLGLVKATSTPLNSNFHSCSKPLEKHVSLCSSISKPYIKSNSMLLDFIYDIWYLVLISNSMLLDFIYGFDMLKQREKCLFRGFWPLMKITVKGVLVALMVLKGLCQFL